MKFRIIPFSSFVRKVTGLVAQMGEHKCIQYFHWKASTWQSESDGRNILNKSLTKLGVRLDHYVSTLGYWEKTDILPNEISHIVKLEIS
jgi:hypothetical protein